MTSSKSSSTLFSATLSDLDSSNADTTKENNDCSIQKEAAFFEGELVSFTSAGDGIAIAAVKVKEENIGSSTESSSSSLSDDTKMEEGTVANMFSKNTAAGTNTASNTGVGQGKQLSFFF